jgi:hypothetical protein
MNAKAAVSILTIYLTGYVIVFAAGFSITLLAYLFLASPVLIIAMIYLVLKDNSCQYPELGENEEWGYRDKDKNELGLF